MQAEPDTANYRDLFLEGAPLLDVRAPVEFSQGAFPAATNIPLITDEERHEVGICYKEKGQQAAIELGHTLVNGDAKQARIEAWRAFAKNHPQGYLYCFRGGLRSQTVQQWLLEAGVEYPLVKGGYKAMRRFLLEELPILLARSGSMLISGKTGTGKTRLINALGAAIDLEGCAKHRGSTFGQILQAQPSQIDFENLVITEILKKKKRFKNLFFEDEGRLIGRVALPDLLAEHMQRSPLMVIVESVSSRVDVVLDDYINDLGRRYMDKFGDSASSQHEHDLRENLARVRKRLGGLLHQQVDDMIVDAFEEQRLSGDIAGHRSWIETLLVKYYDPMYDYQLSKRAGQILATGTRAEITEAALQYPQDDL